MKKAFSLLLIFSLLFLSACKKDGLSPEEKAEELKALYASSSQISFTADITADYGTYVALFSLTYEGSESIGTAVITAPESIAGLTVTYASGGTEASYDGAELYMGELSSDGLSPVDSIPAMLAAWKNGFVSQCVYESLDSCDTIAISTSITEESTMTTWFSLETSFPVRTEIANGEKVVITASFQEVLLT